MTTYLDRQDYEGEERDSMSDADYEAGVAAKFAELQSQEKERENISRERALQATQERANRQAPSATLPTADEVNRMTSTEFEEAVAAQVAHLEAHSREENVKFHLENAPKVDVSRMTNAEFDAAVDATYRSLMGVW
jgi:hypothetical protein